MRYCIPVLLFLILTGCAPKIENTDKGKPVAEEKKDCVEGEFLVKFKPNVTDSLIDEINVHFGTSILSKSEYTGTYRIKIPEDKLVEEMVELYRNNEYVEFAEPNRIIRISPIEIFEGEALRTDSAEEKKEGK